MSIKKYFIIAFSSIFIAGTFLGLTSMFTAQSLRAENERVIYAQVQLRLLKKVKSDTNRLLKEVADFMLLGDEELEEYEEARGALVVTLEMLKESFKGEISYLEAENDDENLAEEREEIQVMTALTLNMAEIMLEADMAVESFARGDREGALQRLENKIEAAFDDSLVALIDAQIVDEQGEIDESYDDLLNQINRFQVSGVTSLSVLLVVVMAATAIAVRTIYRPVYELLEAIKRIGEGDYSIRIKNRGGELGELASNLENMAMKMATTQGQLVQSAKLASIGQLAAGVAHEMNQPLMVISMNAQMIRSDLKEQTVGSEIHGYVDMITKNSKRLTYVIDHLRKFSRQTDVAKTSVNVNAVVESAFTLISQQLKAHSVVLETDFNHDLPEVVGNENELEQVFVNLLTNARDAVNDQKVGRAGFIKVSTDLVEDEGMVRICFADNGTGIPDEVLSRIFDPFFTTKGINEGTGLGLSIVYGIIKEHEGTIRVAETSYEGTVFEVKLPLKESGQTV